MLFPRSKPPPAWVRYRTLEKSHCTSLFSSQSLITSPLNKELPTVNTRIGDSHCHPIRVSFCARARFPAVPGTGTDRSSYGMAVAMHHLSYAGSVVYSARRTFPDCRPFRLSRGRIDTWRGSRWVALRQVLLPIANECRARVRQGTGGSAETIPSRIERAIASTKRTTQRVRERDTL